MSLWGNFSAVPVLPSFQFKLDGVAYFGTTSVVERTPLKLLLFQASPRAYYLAKSDAAIVRMQGVAKETEASVELSQRSAQLAAQSARDVLDATERIDATTAQVHAMRWHWHCAGTSTGTSTTLRTGTCTSTSAGIGTSTVNSTGTSTSTGVGIGIGTSTSTGVGTGTGTSTSTS